MLKKKLLWIIFAIFVASALYFNRGANLWHNTGPLTAGKYIIWLTFLAFLGYSIYCSQRENLFKTIGKIAEYHWGRQVGIDLYLGLFLSLFFIYLNEGSLLIVLLWTIPTILFGNLATLLYFAIHYDQIVARFLH